MTIQDIISKLQSTLDQLDDAGIKDSSARDLRILVLQLDKELEVAAFDPLKDLDSVTVADTKQLASLCDGVQQAIDDEKARVALVDKIVATAKVALRAGGVPIAA